MKQKTRITKLKEQDIFELTNKIFANSAIAYSMIVKHTKMNKANAMLLGIGISLLITRLVK